MKPSEALQNHRTELREVVTRHGALRPRVFVSTVSGIIREAANKTRVAAPDFAARHTHVPWDLTYGMRNRIVHDYFEDDLQVVWQTVQRDRPVLRQQIGALRKDLSGMP